MKSSYLLKKIYSNNTIRNFSYLTCASTISQLIALFTIIKITRLFSPADYGTYSFLITQGTLLYVIADLGIAYIIIRTIARDKTRTRDLIFNGAILRFFAVLIFVFLYVVYNSYLGNLGILHLFFILLFSLINCFSSLFENAFLGNQQMLPISVINLVYSFSFFLIILLLPENYFSLPFVFSLYLFINALKAFVFYAVLIRQNLLVGEIQNFWTSTSGLLKESWPYFSLVLITIPINHLSNNFLFFNSTIQEIGFFNLSYKLTGPVGLVIGLALSSIFPNLSAMWATDEARFYRLISSGFRYFILFALLMCFLFSLFTYEGIRFLFTSEYLAAVEIAKLHIWYIFLIGVNSLIGTVWGAVNKEKLIFKFGIINVLITVPSLYLGSKFGALGLTYGYVLSFAVFQVYLWYMFKKSLNIRIKDDAFMWVLSIILFTVSYVLPANAPMVYKGILALSTVFGCVIYLVKRVKSAEI